MPKTAFESPPMIDCVDPIAREVTFVPSKTPYDPRHMLAGLAFCEIFVMVGLCV